MMINPMKISLCACTFIWTILHVREGVCVCVRVRVCVRVYLGPIVNQFTEFRGLALAIQLTQYLNVAIGRPRRGGPGMKE